MTGQLPEQSFGHYGGYRCYITPDAYVVTYHDEDLVRVNRLCLKHRPGFLLLIVKVLFLELIGRRTSIRDKWAIDAAAHEAEAHELDMAVRAARPAVVEFTVEAMKTK